MQDLKLMRQVYELQSTLNPNLVFPVVLLRVSQDPVAEPADMSERGVPLVP